jgi:hypothetical protein
LKLVTFVSLKNRTYILFVFFSFGTIVINSCTDSKTETLETKGRIIFDAFSEFPNSPFINLQFDDVSEDSKSKLVDFDYIDQGDQIYSNASDSIILILSDEDELTTFKLYLKSGFYLSKNQDLFTKLSSHTNQCIGNYRFAEMVFMQESKPFKLTYFTTDKSIRISYQLIIPHH